MGAEKTTTLYTLYMYRQSRQDSKFKNETFLLKEEVSTGETDNKTANANHLSIVN